jgi:dynein heavy chain 1
MNALLASGEVPGLFEGDDRVALIHAMRDTTSKDGSMVDNEEELWRRFTDVVKRNLHVVFTMNPCGGEWKNRSTTSPALFNRCVVDWFGTWSYKALGQVGKEFTSRLDFGVVESTEWSWGVGDGGEIMKLVEGAFHESELGSIRHAVVAAMVYIHDSTKVAASSASSCRSYLSPRDFLTLIKSFVDCVNEMRTLAEDEQLRISKGLSIIRQTKENVSELELGLGKKGIDLRDKEFQANQKLLQMVADQNEAEKRKEAAERLSSELEKQQNEINARKDEVQRDLDEAEPALISAQASVKGIKRRDLDEVRGLVRPPNAVKLTLECVAIMMNEKSLDWADIRKMLSRADFIPSILNFDVDTLTPRQIKTVS